jgi:drug/metabolite transporter (DMT)-like permease
MLPFLAALADAGGIVYSKIALGKKRMALSVFLPLFYLFMFTMVALLVPILGMVDKELFFSAKYLVMFGTLIIIAIVWNYIHFQTLQKEKLYEHEMFLMLSPAVTILLVSLLFSEEYDVRILIASLVAICALFFSKVEKGHLNLDHYSINLVIAVVLMAIETILIKELLEVFSPVSLIAVRFGFMFLFFLFYFRPHLNMAGKENVKYTAISAIFGVIFMILRFYGYRDLGIIHTTIILLCTPLFVYIASSKLLKEKIKIKTAFSIIIIMVCIVYVTYIDQLSN